MKKKTMALLLGMTLLVTGCGASSSRSAASSGTDIPVKSVSSEAEMSSSLSGENASGGNKTSIPVKGLENTTKGQQESGAGEDDAVLTHMTLQSVEDDVNVPTVNMEYYDMEFRGDRYAKANLTLRRWMQERESAAKQEYADLSDKIEKEKDRDDFYGYFARHNLLTGRADEKMISVLASDTLYGGDAFSCSYEGRTYDVESGNEVSLAELGKDPDTFVEKLKMAYKDQTGEGFWDDPVWYLDAAGIELLCGTDNYLSEDTITVPYSEVVGLLKTDAIPLRTPGIASANAYNKTFLYLQDNEESTEVWLEHVGDEEYYPQKITLHVGENTSDIPDTVDMADNYFVRKDDGKMFMLTTCNLGSDDFRMSVYDITNGSAEKIGESIDNIIVDGSCLSKNEITMAMSVDLFGTYTALADYVLNDDGSLTDTTNIYPIRIYSNYQKLTVTKDLPVILNGEETTLSPGTVIRITGTDNTKTMYFSVLDTGENGEFTFTSDEENGWIKYVDGIRDEDYFEMLPFAG